MNGMVSGYAWMVDVVAGLAFTLGAAYFLLDTGGGRISDE